MITYKFKEIQCPIGIFQFFKRFDDKKHLKKEFKKSTELLG